MLGVMKFMLNFNFFLSKAEPQVVFFRKTSPVIYDGPANEEEILETLMAYKDSCVKDLTGEFCPQEGACKIPIPK